MSTIAALELDNSENGSPKLNDRFGFQCCGRERQVFTLATESYGHKAECNERRLTGTPTHAIGLPESRH
jgi:hypothetical protein